MRLWPSSLVLRNVLVGKLNTWARRENYVIVIKGWEIVTTFEFKERKKDIPEHRDMMKFGVSEPGSFFVLLHIYHCAQHVDRLSDMFST